MVEAYGASNEEILVEPLNFGLEPSAAGIRERKKCTFFPSGASTYAPSGAAHLIKMCLNADGWLTLRVLFSVWKFIIVILLLLNY